MAFIEIEGIGKIEVPDGLSEDQQDQIAQKVVQDYSEAKQAVSPETTADYAARQAGLVTRAAITPTTTGALAGAGIGAMFGGVGALPGAAIGGTAGFLTDIGSRVYSALTGRGKPLDEILEDIKTDIGLPRPATPTERMQQKVVGTVAELAAPASIGKMALKAASPVARKIGEVLTERPVMQGISAITSGIGSSIAEESGAGPIGQAAGGILGAVAPTAPQALIAGARQGVRSLTGVTPEDVRRNIETFAGAGTTPTAGQALGSPGFQSLEAGAAKFPFAYTTMREKGISQQAEVGKRVEELASQLSKQREPSVVGAGIQRGIEDVFLPKSRAIESGLYNRLDESIPKFTPVKAKNTVDALETLIGSIEGAPTLSRNKLVSSQEIRELRDDLIADLLNSEGDIPFSALKGFRSRIGQKLSSVSLASNITHGEYKKIYNGITADLKEAAKQSGADAVTALSRANKYTKALHERADKLQGLVDKLEPEKAYQAAFEGSGLGATRIRAVMQSLPKAEQRGLAAAYISKMGKALPGQQDELGDVFSTERFLTNWNKLNPNAKKVLFDRFGSDYRKNLDKIALAASKIRESSKILANPSGTAASGLQPATYYVSGAALMAGQYGVLAGILGTVGAMNIGSKVFTNPKFVNWLAKNSNIKPDAIPAAISSLSRISEEDDDESLKQIANTLMKQQIAEEISR